MSILEEDASSRDGSPAISSSEPVHAADRTCRRGRYLIIFNVSKKNNIKSLIYTAAAYSFVPIVVGVPAIAQDLHVSGIEYLYYTSFKEMKEFLADHGIPLVAIEIIDGARSILENPFHDSIALMPGNEGSGLNSTQIRESDEFIFIPQYGSGTASLNVNIATTIVLNQYMQWLSSRS